MGVSTNNDITYHIIKPAPVNKPTPEEVALIREGPIDLEFMGPLVGVDIETTGTQAADHDLLIVGLGISDGTHNVYLDWTALTIKAKNQVWDFLSSRELVAHNVMFDSAFITRDHGYWLPWKYCTYGMFRQLANEGYPGQGWGLKEAQLNLLGWDSTNEAELDEWLIRAGLFKGPLKHDHTVEERLTAWEEGKIKSDKGKMHHAPAEILGYYCALDAYSCLKLYTEVFAPAYKNKPWTQVFEQYHQVFIDNVRLLVEQQLRGISLDKTGLQMHDDWLEEEIKQAEEEFLNHEEIRPFVNIWNKIKVEERAAKEPTKYKKLPPLGTEPNRYTKAGAESKTWQRWREKKEKIDKGPEISKNWLKWQEQMEEARAKNHFNINSGKQRQWLFYEQLKYPVVLRTDSGEPAVDKRALLAWGEPGQLLKRNNDLVKEQGYVQACLESLIIGEDNVPRLHPQFRAPGTLTCRLAGSGGVNLQQVPKSKGYLSCYRPEPGYVWVDYDVVSLEQVVLTELSKDPSLWKIYGPGARSNDIYLFNGSQLPVIGEKIRAAGYDPDSPDPEAIAHVKKVCKKERTISKVITLGSSYGMGAGKLKMTLALQGVDVSDRQARDMHAAYWDLYSGVKAYEKYLVREWEERGGWVYNGIGRPVCCAGDYIKDIINRVVQSTGHDILMMINQELDYLREEKEVDWWPIIIDFHDESLVECREQDAPEVCEMFEEAYRRVNDKLKGEIPIRCDGGVISSLWDAKAD